MSRPYLRDLGLAALLAAGGLSLLVLWVPTAPLTGDGAHYVAFARSHLEHGAASAWHARRVLGPLVVAALPLDALDGFHLVTVASLLVAALLTWTAACDLGLKRSTTLLSVLLFLGTWVVAPNLREYALVDPMAWAFVAGIWLATVKQRWWVAVVIGVVGVLAKEVVAIAAVAAAAAAWNRSRGWRGFALPLAVAAPALLAVLALTRVIPGSGTDAMVYLVKWWTDGLGSLGPLRILYLVFASYSALWLLVPRGFALLPSHIKRASAVYLCAAVALPALGSPERMEELIFPAIVTMGVMALDDQPLPFIVLLALANIVFVAHVGGNAPLPTPIAWAGLAVALAVAAWCATRRPYRTLSPQPAA